MSEQHDDILEGTTVDRASADRATADRSTVDRASEDRGDGVTSAAASSLALRDIPVPDYCDVVIVPTRGVDVEDPRVWAEAIFSHENTPLGTRGLRALRDEAVRLFDMVPPPEKQYVTDEVRGSEALIKDDDQNLSVRIGVALLPGGELLQVTTAVKYRSVRGRIAFAPRRMMHAAAVNALARRAPATVRRRALGPRTTGPRTVTDRAPRRALGRGRFLGR